MKLGDIININKAHLLRIFLLVLNILITILMPIFNYIGFKNILSDIECSTCPSLINNPINLGTFEAKYDVFIYLYVFIGMVVSSCSYVIFKFQKYSVQRGFLLFLISIMYIIFIALSSQLSIIFITVSKIQIIMNFSGVYIIFLIVFSLYALKNLFDLVDFKINQSHYITILRKRRFMQKKFNQKMITCSNCEYMCRVDWKKCPICKTKIIITT